MVLFPLRRRRQNADPDFARLLGGPFSSTTRSLDRPKFLVMVPARGCFNRGDDRGLSGADLAEPTPDRAPISAPALSAGLYPDRAAGRPGLSAKDRSRLCLGFVRARGMVADRNSPDPSPLPGLL